MEKAISILNMNQKCSLFNEVCDYNPIDRSRKYEDNVTTYSRNHINYGSKGTSLFPQYLVIGNDLKFVDTLWPDQYVYDKTQNKIETLILGEIRNIGHKCLPM